jgi:hypothetical protein
MNIKTIVEIATEFGDYAAELQEDPKQYPLEQVVDLMHHYAHERLVNTLIENGEAPHTELNDSIAIWIGNETVRAIKANRTDTALFIRNMSKKKIQMNWQSAGIKIEY